MKIHCGHSCWPFRTNWGSDEQLSLPSSTPHTHRKRQFLKNIYDETVSIVTFIKISILDIHILNISCNKMRSTDKTLLLHTKFSRLSMHVIVWAVNSASYFFHGKPFIPEKNDWQMNWLFRLGIWQAFLKKWTKWVCHFKGNNGSTSIVCIWPFKWKLEFWKIFICHHEGFWDSQYFKIFLVKDQWGY